MAHRFRTTNRDSPAAQARAKQYASHEHRRLRATWQRRIDTGQHVTCSRCGHPITRGMVWHLDHDDHDRSQYLGPSHATCNRRAAAQAGNRAQRRVLKPVRRAQSRQW